MNYQKVILSIVISALFHGCVADDKELNVANDTNVRQLKASQQPVEKNLTSNSVREGIDAVMALNHMSASLNKIVLYDDKIILEDEYNNIINNLNLRAINDLEIIEVTTNLMKTLAAFKLSETERAQFQREYEQKLDDAIANASSKVSVVGHTREEMVASLIVSVGSSYMYYQTLQSNASLALDTSNWALKKEDLSKLHNIQKEFLLTYWKIMQRYDIPDRWRITNNQFKRFTDIIKIPNSQMRQRKLLRMKEELQIFPTFWYELAIVAHMNEDDYVEAVAFQKYEELDDQLLKHNSHYSLLLAYQCENYDYKTQQKEISKLLKKMLNVDPLNPERKLFAAATYQLIGNPSKAENLLNENIDDNFLLVPSTRLKLSMYLENENDQAYKNTINELLIQNSMSLADSLFYLGKKPLPSLANRIDQLVQNIQINILSSSYGKDDLILNLPREWIYNGIEKREVVISLNTENINPSETNSTDGSILYTYNDIVDTEAIQNGSIKKFNIKLIDKKSPLSISYEVVPSIERSEENNNTNIMEAVTRYAHETSRYLTQKYNTKIFFVPTSMTTRTRCFDIKNAYNLCN